MAKIKVMLNIKVVDGTSPTLAFEFQSLEVIVSEEKFQIVPSEAEREQL